MRSSTQTCNIPPFLIELRPLTPPSSSGPGRGPLKAKTGIRIPVGAHFFNNFPNQSPGFHISKAKTIRKQFLGPFQYHRGIGAKTGIRIPVSTGCSARGTFFYYFPNQSSNFHIHRTETIRCVLTREAPFLLLTIQFFAYEIDPCRFFQRTICLSSSCPFNIILESGKLIAYHK